MNVVAAEVTAVAAIAAAAAAAMSRPQHPSGLHTLICYLLRTVPPYSTAVRRLQPCSISRSRSRLHCVLTYSTRSLVSFNRTRTLQHCSLTPRYIHHMQLSHNWSLRRSACKEASVAHTYICAPRDASALRLWWCTCTHSLRYLLLLPCALFRR